MKRKLSKMLAIGAFLGLMAGTMTGCGKTEIDVMEGLTVEFNGIDGQGTASLSNKYFWEEAAFEAAGISDSEDLSILGKMAAIEEAVSYEVSPKENLSNGDEVTVRADVDNETAGEYKIKFTAEEKKYTVKGLKEIEQIDLFENIDVEFQGIAPYVKAYIKNGSSNLPVYVSYRLDNNEGLSAGDTVTVTAEYDAGQLLERGYTAGDGTRGFVVPECDSYVTGLSQIPDDTMAKMKKQIEDAIQAKGWDTVTGVEFAGNYFLSLKPGMNGSDYNTVYVLYKIEDVDMENPDEKLYFYTYRKFSNLVLLKDGTCSVDLSRYEMPSGSVFSKRVFSGDIFWRGDYYYEGFQDMDTMFNKCVTKNIESYEYESNVTGE
ncbi:MAG: hypothetical protein K2G55_08980 [Lachnospiraceae bacterium]|nr:hypothetical protein [Lachnospiraceae bacterium]MDE7202212.1 hypothetical protein [Lachnospiraceae bacterium]